MWCGTRRTVNLLLLFSSPSRWIVSVATPKAHSPWHCCRTKCMDRTIGCCPERRGKEWTRRFLLFLSCRLAAVGICELLLAKTSDVLSPAFFFFFCGLGQDGSVGSGRGRAVRMRARARSVRRLQRPVRPSPGDHVCATLHQHSRVLVMFLRRLDYVLSSCLVYSRSPEAGRFLFAVEVHPSRAFCCAAVAHRSKAGRASYRPPAIRMSTLFDETANHLLDGRSRSPFDR